MSRVPAERLDDILSAIDLAGRADERLAEAEAAADETGVEVAFAAILHQLLVIGEAVKALPAEIVALEATTPWNEIAAMRDLIGHHYHRIAPEIIHRTVRQDLPPLRDAVWRLKSGRSYN